MKKSLLFVLPVIALMLIYTSCSKNNFEKDHPIDPAAPVSTCDTTVTMSYSIHIKPILINNCGTNGCHNTASKFGGWDLSVHGGTQGVQQCGLSGQLVAAITGDLTKVNQKMPIGGSLLPCEIAKIRTWVKAGAPDN